MNFQTVMVECQRVDAFLAKCPYQMDLLKRSDAKLTAKTLVQLRGIRKDLVEAQLDLSLSDDKLELLLNHLKRYNALLRKLEN